MEESRRVIGIKLAKALFKKGDIRPCESWWVEYLDGNTYLTDNPERYLGSSESEPVKIYPAPYAKT
jgi:hypothetical protein